MSITIDVVFVLCIGILVGYLLCHLKYRLCEATAAILRGKGQVRERWMSESTRDNVAAVSVIIFIVCAAVLINLWYANHCELKERKLMMDNGYDYVRVDGNYQWKKKLAPPELDNDLAGTKNAK